ncbi:MAG: O-methyltransferase [Candidatus Zixiibacteriota bacterium]
MLSKIEKYLLAVTPERHPVLSEMEQYAKEIGFPIVGPLVGRFLFQMALSIKARRILELGSGFGYSAFWLSQAVRGKGHLTLTDKSAKNKRLAMEYFKRAGLQSQFDFRVADALKIINDLVGPYDMIINDIDKGGYPKVIDPAAALLRKGGLLITDNILWSGRVLEKKQDETSGAVVEFTRNIYRDSRFFTTILPLRDGLSVSVRL